MSPHDLEEIDLTDEARPRPDYFDAGLYTDDDGHAPHYLEQTARRFTDGGAFVFDTPETPAAVWGRGEDVLWAEGEALMIYGGSGVGKTTIAGQLIRALILADGDVLGLPVMPAAGRVLYLAMDRPSQAARSLSRQFHQGAHRELLSQRLTIWKGPPPEDMAEETGLLTQMCREAGASHVFVDSLKDAAVGLSDDRVGAGWNRARQAALAAGIQVAELHHQIKQRNDGPKGIDAVYGSTWITAGAGSVIHLDGQPGDAVVKLRHLKQPAAEVGPFEVTHDARTGLSTVVDDADPLTLIQAQGQLTARDLAGVMFDTDAPKRNDVEKARRKLDALERAGLVTSVSNTTPTGGTGPTVYVLKGKP